MRHGPFVYHNTLLEAWTSMGYSGLHRLLQVLAFRRVAGYITRYTDYCKHCDLHQYEHCGDRCLLGLGRFTAYEPTTGSKGVHP